MDNAFPLPPPAGPDPALRALLDALDEALVVLDAGGRVLLANRAAEALHGKDGGGPVLGRDFFSLVPPDQAAVRRERASEAMGTGRRVACEDEQAGRILAHTFSPLAGAGEGVARLAVGSRDVTASRRAEESLRREMQRHIFLMESLPGFVFILAEDKGIPYANRAFRRIFGSPKGRLCHDVLSGCAGACSDCPALEVFVTQKPAESEWTDKSGETFHLYCHPMTDVDGSLKVLVMGIRITARKRAEQALRQAHDELELRVEQRTAELQESEARYSGLIRNLPVVIFVMAADYRLEFVSEACRRVLGFAPELPLADPDWFWSRLHHGDRDAVREVFRACFEEGRLPFAAEFRFTHSKGYPVHLRALSMPRPEGRPGERPEGGLARVEGIIQDITEHNFLDKLLLQQERSNILGALAAEIAHEFRNPLTSLAGFARLLHRKQPELTEAGIILEEAQRLEGLLARVNVSLQPAAARLEPCDVNALLTFCAKLAAGNLARRSLECLLSLDPAAPSVRTDPDVLLQAFLNLLSNAQALCAERGVIGVGTTGRAQGLEIEFRIEPPAFAIRDTDRLFLPFGAEDGQFNLAVSRRLLGSLGGVLSFEQGPAAATLSVTLPLEPPAAANDQSPARILGDSG
ncbi:MAG: PAS domain-containing protein [Thermodesulfobacteriota bacterium]